MSRIIFILLFLTSISCATIPKASLQLSAAIQLQSEEMYKLNVELVNMYYAQRSKEIDDFINNTYTLKLMQNTKSGLIEADLYNDTTFLNVIPLVNQQVIIKRNYMQTELEQDRLKVINTLNEIHINHTLNCTELYNLLESAVKIDEETKLLMKTIDDLTENKLNLQQLNTKVDSLLIDAGKISKKVENTNNILFN